jgi:hypothetical protein
MDVDDCYPDPVGGGFSCGCCGPDPCPYGDPCVGPPSCYCV